MPKRSLESSSPDRTQNRAPNNKRRHKLEKIYSDLRTIVSNIKTNSNNIEILYLIKQFVQNDNENDDFLLITLLLRFLLEIKNAYERIKNKQISDIKNDKDLILINKIRMISQLMQEGTIDQTLIIKQNNRHFSKLNDIEYNDYIMKNKTSYGVEIEFSAMKIMEIAYNKLMDIQTKYGIGDIFDELEIKTQHSSLNRSLNKNSPQTTSLSIQQFAGNKANKPKYYKTKMINNVSKRIFKIQGDSKQYIKKNHHFITITEYKTSLKEKRKMYKEKFQRILKKVFIK
jgi:uncharacterized protein YbcV (DUF1398 family)